MKPPLRQGSPDDFQTPPYALKPLLPHLNPKWTIWECACGKGNLVHELRRQGFSVISTDLLTGKDFLNWQPEHFDCVITNPPYRYKQQFLERCYELHKPFALLLPLTTFETARRQHLFKRHGVEVILLDRRIDFETPAPNPGSASWFATAWFTAHLDIGRQLSFESIQNRPRLPHHGRRLLQAEM